MNGVYLKENYYALILSILKRWTPEQSFLYLETGENAGNQTVRKDITNEDVQDMISLQKQGFTYRQISEIYNASMDLVRRRIKRAKVR